MIFIDTGAWFARFVPEDPAHIRLREWFASNTVPLVTTDYCVDETLTLLGIRNRPTLAVQAGRILFDESVAIVHFLTRQQLERSFVLFQQRVTSGWSFTDCTSKIVVDDLGIRSAVALDRHFHEFGVQIVP